MITLDKFQGHIVLYCKGHYDTPKGDKGFFEGLKMIWAIRCGFDYKQSSRDVLTYIANDMYNIIAECEPKRLPHLMDLLHREIGKQAFYKPKDMTPIEAIIWEYRGILCDMQIMRKTEDEKWECLVKLHRPYYQVFNRILRGNGMYEDYEKIKNRD